MEHRPAASRVHPSHRVVRVGHYVVCVACGARTKASSDAGGRLRVQLLAGYCRQRPHSTTCARAAKRARMESGAV